MTKKTDGVLFGGAVPSVTWHFFRRYCYIQTNIPRSSIAKYIACSLIYELNYGILWGFPFAILRLFSFWFFVCFSPFSRSPKLSPFKLVYCETFPSTLLKSKLINFCIFQSASQLWNYEYFLVETAVNRARFHIPALSLGKRNSPLFWCKVNVVRASKRN